MEVLFNIVEIQVTDLEINTSLYINNHSTIFNGHFPGQPLVPGACMLQVIKDVLEQGLNNRYRLKKADSLKFISMINPESTSSVHLNLSYKLVDDTASVTAKITDGDAICFKFQGVFIKA